MTRVLILGGRGCVGRRVAAACRALPGTEVTIAGREARDRCVAVDLRDSANLKALADYEFVVNCTDASALPPDRAAAYCLHSGSTFVELSAHADVVERMWRDLGDDPDPQGRVVLGGGLFPGVSNVLAADLVRRTPQPLQRLELGVRMSAFSAAGRGTCRTVAELIGRPAERVVRGMRWRHEPLRSAGELPVSGGAKPALSVGLAEARMLHWSTGVGTTGALLATSPWPTSVQRLAVTVLPWKLMEWAPAKWLVGAGGVRAARWVVPVAGRTDGVGGGRRSRVADPGWIEPVGAAWFGWGWSGCGVDLADVA